MFFIAIVGKRIDGDAATWCEDAEDLDIARIHHSDEIFHDDIYTIFVKVTVVAETEQVELQAFTFYHIFARNIVDDDASEVRLTCLGAQ